MGNKKNEREGIRKTNHQGLWMEVAEYHNNHNILVRFDDGVVVTAKWRDFVIGYTSNPNYPRGDSPKKEREGEEQINHQGCVMKIIEYKSAREVTVQFDNISDHVVKTTYRYFKTGVTHNPFIPTVYGVGILGNECPSSIKENAAKEYWAWSGMIERCYSPRRKAEHPTYENCTVCDEFLYYPNFYRWLTSQENYDAWKNNPNFNIDKDIICKGNKEYSPDKCCLVPNRINNLIKISRRSKYLLGVHYDKSSKKYYAKCKDSNSNKYVSIGPFNTEYEAFLAYKQRKEAIIKEAAEREYANGMISKQCRDALLRYEIEVTD